MWKTKYKLLQITLKEEASDNIKSVYTGEPIEIGFNVNYLIDVLNVIKTKNVRAIKDANSSALLAENDGALQVM